MAAINFADLDGRYKNTPPQLIGMYPLGGGGLVEAPYRHYFECRHLERIIHFGKQMNILELGSGSGRWAVSLAPLVNHYTGVDLTHKAVVIAREAIAAQRISNAEFYEQSILDFKGNRPYDVIYFSGVSQYLENDQLQRVLDNLSPWMTPGTVIVDRSTISYRAREVVSRKDYYAILRTSQEIRDIFRPYGFFLKYSKRSYRFLRGARFLLRPPLDRILPQVVQLTAPASLWMMLGASFVIDHLHPIVYEGGNLSHDFLLFNRSRT
jgi:SAM-dependent methyltransferase